MSIQDKLSALLERVEALENELDSVRSEIVALRSKLADKPERPPPRLEEPKHLPGTAVRRRRDGDAPPATPRDAELGATREIVVRKAAEEAISNKLAAELRDFKRGRRGAPRR